MKICKWAECGAEFEPVQDNQEFCKPEHRHAHNNWLKKTGIHLCPRALYYVQDLANHCHVSADEKANEMILKMANADGISLTNEEAAGLKEVSRR